MLLHSELGKRGGHDLQDKCKITFLTSEPYIGHLGLGGAGDSKAVLSKLFKKKNIDSFVNCNVKEVTKDIISFEYNEVLENGEVVTHQATIPSRHTMMIPPFRGQPVWAEVPELTDKNGMIITDEHMQSPKYPNIFAVGVCVSLPPVEKTLIPTGTPKTGYMIESMGTAAVKNIRDLIIHKEKKTNFGDHAKLHHKALLNGLCLTDFGNDGAIFLTSPQIPPRRIDITVEGKVATLAKIAFEKYFLHKVMTGDTDPYYEKYMLHLIGMDRTAKE